MFDGELLSVQLTRRGPSSEKRQGSHQILGNLGDRRDSTKLEYGINKLYLIPLNYNLFIPEVIPRLHLP